MKIARIVLLITFAIITPSAFAAVMSVYNETGNRLDVIVFTSNGMQLRQIIPIGRKASFNSGLSSFQHITWVPNNNQISYHCDIPSTKFMLMGTIVLYPQGKLTLNFDDRGASSEKIVNRTASQKNIYSSRQ